MGNPTRVGELVFVRPPSKSDRDEFLELMHASRHFHGAQVAPPSTVREYEVWMTRMQDLQGGGVLVFRLEDGVLVGAVELCGILRRPFYSAMLQFYAGVDFAGLGYFREALPLALDFAFGELRLHRLEGNVQPENKPARALLRRCGFRHEGFAPRLVKLRGRWRDCERWGLLAEEWLPDRRSQRLESLSWDEVFPSVPEPTQQPWTFQQSSLPFDES